MTEQAERWRDVADAINARMSTRTPPMSQADLVRTSGVSDPTIRDLMRGTPGGRRKETLWKVSLALGWPRDHLHRILAGEPTAGPAEPAVSSELAEIRALVEAIQTRIETERAEAARHGAAIARLADGVQQLLDAMPLPPAVDRPPTNAGH